MEQEKTIGRLSRTLRLGGYLISGGAIAGFSTGLYFSLNYEVFSFFIHFGFGIWQRSEVMSYFLSVSIPSFVLLIIIGYLFSATLGLKRVNLSSIMPLCALSILSMLMSALSVFYFISFLGGLLTLTALIKSYTKPTFRMLTEREAFFMVEIGATFVASSSILFLSMWLLSNVFQTYAMGLYASSSPYALFMVGIVSFLMFFVVSHWGSRGATAGLSGILGLAMSILSYLFAVQNRYALSSAAAYIGIFLLVLGFVSALGGELLYIRLFFSKPEMPATIFTSSLLEEGKYCPNCGTPRATASQKMCSHCGRSLTWTPYAPFCFSCGRLVPTDAQACPHCKDGIENKRIYFYMKDSAEQALVSKLVKESGKKKSWLVKKLPIVFRRLERVGRAVWSVNRLFYAIDDRLSLSLRQVVFIMILTYVFGFFSFIGYVSVVPAKLYDQDVLVLGYGLPLSWLQVYFSSRPLPYVADVDVLWISLLADVTLYFFASFTLVYGVARLRR